MNSKDQTETALTWLGYADLQDHENTWRSASAIFQAALERDDWRRALKAARSPLGSVKTRELENVEPLVSPDGAPDGHYAKLLFNSSFEQKISAQETVTLFEDSDGHWRVAGYFIK